MEYSQPDFYHFTEDSLFLIQSALKFLKNRPLRHVLDVGAGCGIVGIEFCIQHNKVNNLWLLELQKDFNDYIEKNIKCFLPKTVRARIDLESLESFKPNTFFDLILCNPPYFDSMAGRKSPDIRKQKCRSFEVGSAEMFLINIEKLLNPHASAFILIPNKVGIWEKALRETKLNLKKYEQRDHVSVYLISKIDLDE